MAVKKGIDHWLKCLQGTMHFEQRATVVFERLIRGRGPGLLVLYGPAKLANKTYFLNVVEALQKGASVAKPFVSRQLWGLLGELEAGQYQCVSLAKDYPIDPSTKLFAVPLAAAVPLALAAAAERKGLHKGRNVVVLCDDLDEFVRWNKQANEQFLTDLGRALDKQRTVTFLGASGLDWDAKAVLGFERVLDLGWD